MSRDIVDRGQTARLVVLRCTEPQLAEQDVVSIDDPG
jgi:hypothetical protein